jgi:hypothetical protein
VAYDLSMWFEQFQWTLAHEMPAARRRAVELRELGVKVVRLSYYTPNACLPTADGAPPRAIALPRRW